MGFWRTLAKVATFPVVHPQRTLKGALTAAKTSAVALPVGYLGWEKLTTDKSLARIVGEATMGKDTVDTVNNVAGDMKSLRTSAETAIDKVNTTLSDVDSQWGGVKKFFQGLFGGHGGNMLGDFFSNLGSGKVSGLGIAGLIGAALLVFGRFGWFGKIAGALLGMFVIGNNFDFKRIIGGQTAPAQTVGTETPYARASVYSPKDDPQKVFVKAWGAEGKDYPAIPLSREQYDSLVQEGYTPVQIYHGLVQMRQEEEKKSTGLTR